MTRGMTAPHRHGSRRSRRHAGDHLARRAGPRRPPDDRARACGRRAGRGPRRPFHRGGPRRGRTPAASRHRAGDGLPGPRPVRVARASSSASTCPAATTPTSPATPSTTTTPSAPRCGRSLDVDDLGLAGRAGRDRRPVRVPRHRPPARDLRRSARPARRTPRMTVRTTSSRPGRRAPISAPGCVRRPRRRCSRACARGCGARRGAGRQRRAGGPQGRHDDHRSSRTSSRQVGGDRVDVDSLVPKGGEVHTFDPTPVRRPARQRGGPDRPQRPRPRRLAGRRSSRTPGTTAPVVRLGEDLPGRDLPRRRRPGRARPRTRTSGSTSRMPRKYVERIARPSRRRTRADATAYRGAGRRLRQGARRRSTRRSAHGSARSRRPNRIVISFHDAFPYFAARLRAHGRRHDRGRARPGPERRRRSPPWSPTIRDKRRQGDLRRGPVQRRSWRTTIADETGAAVVSDLYTDSVGDAPPDTYVGMMRSNVDRVVAALGGADPEARGAPAEAPRDRAGTRRGRRDPRTSRRG